MYSRMSGQNSSTVPCMIKVHTLISRMYQLMSTRQDVRTELSWVIHNKHVDDRVRCTLGRSFWSTIFLHSLWNRQDDCFRTWFVFSISGLLQFFCVDDLTVYCYTCLCLCFHLSELLMLRRLFCFNVDLAVWCFICACVSLSCC